METIFDQIDSSEDVGEETKKTLKSRLRTLAKAKGFPKQLKRAINATTDQNAMRLNYAHAVLSVYRKSSEFERLIGDKQRKEMLLYAEALKDDERSRRNKGEKRETDIEWKDLLACEDKFPKTGEARLVFLLYTQLPPVRADYTPMLIVDSKEDADDEDLNYYVREKKPYILLNQYKTSGKYGQQRFDVPKKLADAVPTDQEWMFQTGDDPITASALSKKVSRYFAKYCGKKLTINTLRRSYAAYTMTLSKEEQIEAALALGHSLSVHREYARRGEA